MTPRHYIPAEMERVYWKASRDVMDALREVFPDATDDELAAKRKAREELVARQRRNVERRGWR